MAKQLSKDQWHIIQVRFEAGEPATRIAKDYGVSDTAVKWQAKNRGWSKKLAEVIDTTVDAITNLAKTSEKLLPHQKDMVNTIVSNKLDDKLDNMYLLNDTIKMALKLQKNITTMVSNKLRKGEYEPHQAAAILASQGLKVDGLAKMAGIETIQSPSDDKEDNFNGAVHFYLPDNGRD